MTFRKPCEEALEDLTIAYNRLADQWEEMHELLGYCHTGTGNIVCERGGIGCSVRHSWIAERLSGL